MEAAMDTKTHHQTRRQRGSLVELSKPPTTDNETHSESPQKEAIAKESWLPPKSLRQSTTGGADTAFDNVFAQLDKPQSHINEGPVKIDQQNLFQGFNFTAKETRKNSDSHRTRQKGKHFSWAKLTTIVFRSSIN